VPLHWQPVGPEPAEVYWRRRAVALLVVLALLGVLGWLVGRAGGGDDTLAAAGRPTPTPSAAPASATPSATPEPVEPCPDEALEVVATAAGADVGVGARTLMTLTVRNTGTVACTRALGQGAVELVVTSGEDRVWSSDDCAPGGDEGVVQVAPGDVQTARATWPGTRSAPGCPPDQPVAQPGTYRVSARVGELRVPGAVFRVQP
jgi:hypothetical protein